MKAFVIEYEEHAYDFERGDFVNSVSAACLLPTREIAEELKESRVGDGTVREIDIVKVEQGEIRLYEHDSWDEGFEVDVE